MNAEYDANAQPSTLRLREHFESLQLQLERYRDLELPECDSAWFISRVGHHINQALVTGEWVDGLRPPIAQLTPEHIALEMRLRGMVKWLEENQPDVFKRGIWESIP